MMGRRALKKRIESLLKRMTEHEVKIHLEEERENPDQSLIRHWNAEVVAFRKNIERAKKRLGS